MLNFLKTCLNSKKSPRPSRQARRSFRPIVEALEDRIVQNVLTVNSIADSMTSGTLRYEINKANNDAANGVADSISFASSLNGQTINLTMGQLEMKAGLHSNVDIYINGGNKISISGNNASNIFQVDSGAHLGLQNLTLENGVADNAGPFGLTAGGAIINNGATSVLDCTFQDNSAVLGGAIANAGTMTIVDSTFTANNGGDGGAIYSSGSNLTLDYCTLASNAASVNGGAIYNTGTATLNACTVSQNMANTGGGLYAVSVVKMTDTIVAGNSDSAGQDIAGGVAGSHDLIGNGAGLTGISNGVNSNHVGTASAPIDAELNTLANNGGPTETMSLLPNSPAIGAGVAIAGFTTDQRGVAIPNPASIGAYQTAEKIFSIKVAAQATVIAGNSFNVTITALNAAGNAVTGYSGPATFVAGSSSPVTVILTNGTVIEPISELTVAGVTHLSAVIGNISGSTSITVTPAVMSSLSVSTSSTTVTAGAALSVTVTAKDSFGNTVTNFHGGLAFTANDGQKVYVLSGFTFVNGTAKGTVTFHTADIFNLTATFGDTSGMSGLVVVNAGAPAHISVSVPSGLEEFEPFNVFVSATDQYGNAVIAAATLTCVNSQGQTLLINPNTYAYESSVSVSALTQYATVAIWEAGNWVLKATVDGVTQSLDISVSFS